LGMLKDVLANDSVQLIAQNFPFDSTILGEDLGLDCRGLWMDTMLVHHACWCELPKSLDFLVSMYTRHPRYSDYDPSVDEETWRYNCHDAALTFAVATSLEGEARELGVLDFYHNHIQPTMIELTRMQNRGVLVDIELRARLAVRQMIKLTGALVDIEATTGTRLNPGSSKQVQAYLYDTLKVPRKFNKHTGSVTADEKALRSIMGTHPEFEPAISTILDYRKAQKLIGTFLTSKLSRETKGGKRNIMRTSYRTSGTSSGRISSAKTIFDEGGNLQNIPKSNIRRMYIAREGHKLLRADLSQAEFRVVVWLAKITRIIDRYREDPDFDIHTWNASNIYQVPEVEVTKLQRNSSKAVVHGGNYGLGYKLAVEISRGWGLSISYREMKRAMEMYRATMPEIRLWWESIQDELKRTRTLTTPLGRRRSFLGRLDNAMFRSAYSFKPQGLVGDIINQAIGKAEFVLPPGNYPILQVHDEIVWEVETSRVDELLPVIRDLMTVPVMVEGVSDPLVIPVEIEIGDKWYKMKEVDNGSV